MSFLAPLGPVEQSRCERIDWRLTIILMACGIRHLCDWVSFDEYGERRIALKLYGPKTFTLVDVSAESFLSLDDADILAMVVSSINLLPLPR